MRHARVRFAAVTFAALVVAACASSGANPKASDGTITSKVKSRLTGDPEVSAHRIDVDTIDGVVTLSGTVRSDAERTEAVHLAATTTGVVRVVDEIKVGDKAFTETMDDAWIVTKVTTKLTTDPEVNSFRIDVDCNLGVVTLRGTVRTATQRVEAEKLATGTDGVRRVVNLIEVE